MIGSREMIGILLYHQITDYPISSIAIQKSRHSIRDTGTICEKKQDER